MVIHFEHDGRNALHIFNSDPRSFKVLVILQKRFFRIQLRHIQISSFANILVEYEYVKVSKHNHVISLLEWISLLEFPKQNISTKKTL